MKPEGSLPCSKDPATNGISRATRIQSMTTHSVSWRSTLISHSTSRGAPMPGEEILYGGSSVWSLRHVTFLAPMLRWPPDWLLCGPYSHLRLGIPRNDFLHVTSSKAPRIYHPFYFDQCQNIQVRLYNVSENSSLRNCCCPHVGRNIVLGLPSRMLFP
jgi:hypothetical protein